MRNRQHLAVATVAAAVLAAAAIGCSKSSTGPSDPFVGTWKLTWSGVSQSMSLQPSPWTITVSKNGAGYAATYGAVTWSYTNPPSGIDTFSNPQGFAIRNDSLLLLVQDPSAPACTLSVAGTFIGNTATGFAIAGGQMCVPGNWPWNATKQ